MKSRSGRRREREREKLETNTAPHGEEAKGREGRRGNGKERSGGGRKEEGRGCTVSTTNTPIQRRNDVTT